MLNALTDAVTQTTVSTPSKPVSVGNVPFSVDSHLLRALQRRAAESAAPATVTNAGFNSTLARSA